MAGIVKRKPLIGFAAGLLFGGLGYLLLGVEGAGGAACYLFKVAGSSFLFVGLVSLLTAAYTFLHAGRFR